jgi:hypothetical protein
MTLRNMYLEICGNVARWMARTLSLLYFAFIAIFVLAHAVSPEGLPSIWKMSPAEQLDTVALLLVVVGGVVGWKWEPAAAVITLSGTALWLFVERNLLWPPGLSILIGVLYAFAWWSTKQPFVTQEHPIP